MSSPREAIYDVLLSQKQRATLVDEHDALREEWERYEAQNRAADAEYTRRSR